MRLKLILTIKLLSKSLIPVVVFLKIYNAFFISALSLNQISQNVMKDMNYFQGSQGALLGMCPIKNHEGETNCNHYSENNSIELFGKIP